MSVNNPIVNAPNLYINQLYLTWYTTATIGISYGSARDSTNVNDIILSDSVPAIVVATDVQGANGLDIGTIAASTIYAVYIVGDSTGNNSPVGLISLSFTEPTIPFGYDMFRRVGAILTDGSSYIRKFDQVALNSTDRYMYYDASVATLITSGSSSTYAAVVLTNIVPPVPMNVIFSCVFTPSSNSDNLTLVPTGSTSSGGYAVLGGSVAHPTSGMLTCPCSVISSVPSVDYKVVGSDTAINVQGYIDLL